MCVKFHFTSANTKLAQPMIFNVRLNVTFDGASRYFSQSEASRDSSSDALTGTVTAPGDSTSCCGRLWQERDVLLFGGQGLHA